MHIVKSRKYGEAQRKEKSNSIFVLFPPKKFHEHLHTVSYNFKWLFSQNNILNAHNITPILNIIPS